MQTMQRSHASSGGRDHSVSSSMRCGHLCGSLAPKDACVEARRLSAAHVADIRAKISDLQAMGRILLEAICECKAGSRNFVAAIVTAQMLTQIGAFTLPALLPGYIGSWSLSKTEAGWLIRIFFAAYVPAVPVLLTLTDRVPARCDDHAGYRAAPRGDIRVSA
jgi:hypothetical protein